MKLVVVICACLVLFATFMQPAAADSGDGLKNMFSNMLRFVFQGDGGEVAPTVTPHNSISAQVLANTDKYEALDEDVDRLAVKDNLEQLYAIMEERGFSAVRVNVVEGEVIQRTYYLVYDVGVVKSFSGNVDKTYTITYDQAVDMIGMVEDGNVSFTENVEIVHILTGKSKILEYIKLSMGGI